MFRMASVSGPSSRPSTDAPPSVRNPSTGRAWLTIVSGLNPSKLVGQVAEVVVRQAGVDADRVDGHVEQVGEGERVGERVQRQHLAPGPADEELLAGDAAEVAGGVGLPVAVLVVALEVPGPGEGQGLLAVEVDAARTDGAEARAAVAVGRVEVDGTPPMASTMPLEAGEVDLDVVVDRDAEVLLDRVDQHLAAVAVRRVDAARCARWPRGSQRSRGNDTMSTCASSGSMRGDHDRVGAAAADRVGAAERRGRPGRRSRGESEPTMR